MRRRLALVTAVTAIAASASCSGGGSSGAGGGSSKEPPYTTRWAHVFTGIDNISDTNRHGLAALQGGDGVLGGTFWGPIDLGEGDIQPMDSNYDEAFEVSLGKADGAPRWGHHWSSSLEPVRCKSVAADGAGHIALVGYSEGSVDFGKGPVDLSSGATEWFGSFDESGALLFAARVSGGPAELHEIAAAGKARFVAVGTAAPSADVFGMSVGGDAAGDALVFEVDAGGMPIWARTIGGNGAQEATHVAASSTAIALTMKSSGPIDVAGKMVSGSFVVKLAADGTPQWTYDLGGSDGEAVAIDASDRTYVATSYANGNKANLVALGADGAKIWEHAFEGSPSGSTGNARGLAVDASGHLLVTGRVANALRIDDHAFGESAQGSGFAGYVLSLDASNGDPLWIRTFGGDAEVEGDAIVAAADGTLLVKGAFTKGSVDAGTGPLQNPGDKAFFVAQLGPAN